MDVKGAEHITVYRASVRESGEGDYIVSPCERNFCSVCGSGLWAWDPRWPELVHPFASAIDTDLPVPPERTHLMLASKPAWVQVNDGPSDKQFEQYPDESIADWHQRNGVVK